MFSFRSFLRISGDGKAYIFDSYISIFEFIERGSCFEISINENRFRSKLLLPVFCNDIEFLVSPKSGSEAFYTQLSDLILKLLGECSRNVTIFSLILNLEFGLL